MARLYFTAILMIIPLLSGAQLSVSVNAIPITCNDYCDGDLTAVPAGGTAPYTYQWLPSGQTTQSISFLCPGTYSVTVTDATGLTASANHTLSEPDPINITVSATPSICGDSTGTAFASATGGSGTYIYQYDLVHSFSFRNPETQLKPGVYCLTVIDDKGCFEAACVYIQSYGGVTALLNDSAPATCPDACDGTMKALTEGIGSEGPYSFSWTDGSGSVVATGEEFKDVCGDKEYKLHVTSSEGCKDSTTVSVPSLPRPGAGFTFDPSNPDSFNPVVSFHPETDSSVVSLFWNFGEAGTSAEWNPVFTFPEDEAVYAVTLTVTNNLGCTAKVIKEVAVNGDFGIYMPNAFSPDGNSINDTFYPQGYGISPDNYSFSIFNRWGELLFITRDPGEGWNGSQNSHPCSAGLYIWQIRLRDVTGKTRLFTGHLTLLR